MTEPLISVIIPTYQHAATLPKCLDSVLAQTYFNIKIIVVNDGSTDNTSEVLEKYSKWSGVRGQWSGIEIKIINQENQGANPARNRGLAESKGEFVIFCDADVIMNSDMLERMKRALDENPDASYAYSAFKFGWKKFKGIPFDAQLLRKQNYIHTGSLVRRKDFPGFDEHILRLQDWDVWLTMLEQGNIGVLVDGVLCKVLVSGRSRIGSSWLPSYMYRVPWHKFGVVPEKIRKYEQARKIINNKHKL